MSEAALTFKSLSPDQLTWETALRLFYLRCKSQNLAEGTRTLYAKRLESFCDWLKAQDAPRPSAVTAAHLRAYMEHCKARGNKDLTVDCVFRILNTFWGFLLRDGLVLLNPMAKVERPRSEKRFIRPVTDEQLRTILAGIDSRDPLGLRDRALILFLADTGLRISEAINVRIADVDWANDSVLVFGKGRKERRVAFGQTARRSLMDWIRRRGGEGQDWLWINRFGEKLTAESFRQRVKKLTRRLGIAAERLSPHALRHFFALSFLKNGGDVMALQKLLGHATLDMVRNYVNMTDDDALAKHRQASPLDKMGPLPNERKRVKLK